MPWMYKLRLRVFALLVGLVLLVLGVVGMLSVPVLPAVGAALAIAVTVVNSMTSRLSMLTCAGCGSNLEHIPAGTHGIACTNCGTVNHPFNSGVTESPNSGFVYDIRDAEFDFDSDELA